MTSAWVRSHGGAAEPARPGRAAVVVCASSGFIPDNLTATPAEVAARLAERVGVAPAALDRYAATVDDRVRRHHVALVIERAGWRTCGRGEWKRLGDWLAARAWSTTPLRCCSARPSTISGPNGSCGPDLERLMRAVGRARVAAGEEIDGGFARCSHRSGVALDALVATDDEPRDRPAGAGSAKERRARRRGDQGRDRQTHLSPRVLGADLLDLT